MKKIKVIFTGGTISTSIENNQYDVNNDGIEQYRLIDSFRKKHSEIFREIDFIIDMPLSILSEEMTVEHLNTLINSLKDTDFNELDGLIITHGTDTLAYTASILSILLAGVNIPIMLVSSNLPLSIEKANGLDNFKNAIDFILNTNYRGVFCTYRNSDGRNFVHLGSRIEQCERLTDDFFSGKDLFLGEFVGGVFQRNNNVKTPKDVDFLGKKSTDMLLSKISELSRTVLMLNPYVGMDYRSITPTPEIKAVLHTLYHSGTAITLGNNSIITFNKEHKHLPIFCCSNSLQSTYYSSKSRLFSGNIIPLCTTTQEVAYAKLLIATSLYDELLDITAFMDKEYFFENI